MFSTPLAILWSDDKHCGKNTPTMKTYYVVTIHSYFRCNHVYALHVYSRTLFP